MIDRPTFAMDSAAHRRTPSSGQRRDGERSESGRVRAADERAVLNGRAARAYSNELHTRVRRDRARALRLRAAVCRLAS